MFKLGMLSEKRGGGCLFMAVAKKGGEGAKGETLYGLTGSPHFLPLYDNLPITKFQAKEPN